MFCVVCTESESISAETLVLYCTIVYDQCLIIGLILQPVLQVHVDKTLSPQFYFSLAVSQPANIFISLHLGSYIHSLGQHFGFFEVDSV